MNQLKELLIQPATTGESIISLSRAILHESMMLELDLNDPVFSVFLSIDDQFEDVELQGFGRYDRASPRYRLENGERSAFQPIGPIRPDSPGYQAEIQAAWDDFRMPFEEARVELREHLER
jgi:hypothetical protein